MPDQADSTLRVILLDSPRTCSHLLRRIFQNHAQLSLSAANAVQTLHRFSAASTFGPERIQLKLNNSDAAKEANDRWRAAMPDRASATFAGTLKEWQENIATIESKGKVPFVKEHIVTVTQQDIIIDTLRTGDYKRPEDGNTTVIPTELLLTFKPVFLIRHPALVIPSNYRISHQIGGLTVEDDYFRMTTSARWTKMGWDFFTAHGITPVVVDAGDLVSDPEAVATKMCEQLGLSTEGLEYTWDPVPKEHWPKDEVGIVENYIGVLLSSGGVQKKAKGAVDIDAEQTKWSEQYGKDVARGMRKLVDQQMPIYEELKSHKLQV